MIYNLLIFEVICKRTHFSRQYVKLTVKVYLILCAEPTGTRNQDPRPLSNSFQFQESNRGLRIGKQASIENYVFRGKPYYLDLCEILVT